jgi:hypothetical protein
MDNFQLFDFSLDYDKGLVHLKLSLGAIIPVIVVWLGFIIWRYFKKSEKTPHETTEMEITYGNL